MAISIRNSATDNKLWCEIARRLALTHKSMWKYRGGAKNIRVRNDLYDVAGEVVEIVSYKNAVRSLFVRYTMLHSDTVWSSRAPKDYMESNGQQF